MLSSTSSHHHRDIVSMANKQLQPKSLPRDCTAIVASHRSHPRCWSFSSPSSEGYSPLPMLSISPWKEQQAPLFFVPSLFPISYSFLALPNGNQSRKQKRKEKGWLTVFCLPDLQPCRRLSLALPLLKPKWLVIFLPRTASFLFPSSLLNYLSLTRSFSLSRAWLKCANCSPLFF